MRILLLGAGGREHALGWKLRASDRVDALAYIPGTAPSNAGLGAIAETILADPSDPDAVRTAAKAARADLVVVGPEAPLVAGVADALEGAGFAVFGPSRSAARLEGSKAFSKEFMQRHDIPTAAFRIFHDAGQARAWLDSPEARFPLVVKADGLAAGKGVTLCDRPEDAHAAVADAMERRVFGSAGERIVIEERLAGREASYFLICDGNTARPLETCQDYKRAGDGDRGPNTGGMGGFSPSPFLGAALREEVERRIVRPTLDGLAEEGAPFRGLLYVGLMLTDSGPRVLEYNVRFGDPETQLLMPRLESDLATLLLAAARGDLAGQVLRWSAEVAVGIVAASAGYPGASRSGLPIEGLDRAARKEKVVVFQAGTRRGPGGHIETSGGRVLCVTALGTTYEDARRRAGETLADIHFDGLQHRTDIAAGLV